MATKDRPILFSAPMVRALLDGTKTQTRRVFKAKNGGVWPHNNDIPGMRQIMRNCPYGQPGDQLWVRENFSEPHCMEKTNELPAMPPSQWPIESSIWYWADGNPQDGDWTKPRPSMFMPRWASRIALEITGVRVERLQDISESDAAAEGVSAGKYTGLERANARTYSELWEQINGHDSWDLNPWVWVIEFKRVKP